MLSLGGGLWSQNASIFFFLQLFPFPSVSIRLSQAPSRTSVSSLTSFSLSVFPPRCLTLDRLPTLRFCASFLGVFILSYISSCPNSPQYLKFFQTFSVSLSSFTFLCPHIHQFPCPLPSVSCSVVSAIKLELTTVSLRLPPAPPP